MSARQPSPHGNIARRWLALAERRLAHFIDLRDSGRWRHYYVQQADIHEAVQEAVRIRDRWAGIADVALALSSAAPEVPAAA
jgi:uncharacterized repeat protein (TIGR03809 family)